MGQIKYNNEVFYPMKVDKTRIIIENIDENLENDILMLYTDNLMRDIEGVEFNIEKIRTGYLMITLNKSYGKFQSSLFSLSLNNLNFSHSFHIYFSTRY
jgi:hypothetical protein